MRLPTLLTTTTALLLTTTACVEPQPSGTTPCGVSEPGAASTATQAIAVLVPQLQIVLDDDLGGVVCTTGTSESCDDLFATSCIGTLDAVVGEPQEVAVVLRANGPLNVGISSVAVVSDCGWRLDDESGFTIDAGAEVPVIIGFTGTTVGVCAGRLSVVLEENNQTHTVTLRSTVVAD